MTEGTTHAISPEIRPYLDTLADRLQSGHAAVMVGSGFSKNATPSASAAPFPDWSELGDRFWGRLRGHGHVRRPRYMQVPALAHEVEAVFGRSELNQMLRDAIPDLMHGPSPLHVKLLDLPWTDVLTTNYDTLLERACRSVVSRRYDIVVRPEDLGQSTQPRIIKLHGTLQVSERLIVTDEDYRTYPHDFAPFVNTVRQALLEKTLCLIGFSGDDPNFLQWVGWIRDNLSTATSPKTYLIGVGPLRHSQRRLLERRHIIPIDMSECSDGDGNPNEVLGSFLDYLKSRAIDDNPLDWPGAMSSDLASTGASDIEDIVNAWKSQRRTYPGWVIVPGDRRKVLWSKTQGHLRKLSDITPNLGPRDLEFAFELTWRTEKCLFPLLESHLDLLELVVASHWPVPDSDAAGTGRGCEVQEPHPTGLSRQNVAAMCYRLLLAMMRHYREEGLSDKWAQACARMDSVKDTLAPELAARLHHEKVMFAMFSLDLEGMRSHLRNWTEDGVLPFWSAKKAALVAEFGQVDEATQLLEESLEALRLASNVTPTKSDYTLLSEESFVMVLRDVLRQRSAFLHTEGSELTKERQVFVDRWHALRQYKCDPWHELEMFTYKLKPEPARVTSARVVSTFDIGNTRRTHGISIWDTEALVAYSFLRFCEDSGIPFRIPGLSIATATAAQTLKRISGYSPRWAATTLVRIGASDAVDELFDRAALLRMDQNSVDALVSSYLKVLRSAMPDIELGDRWDEQNFGIVLAGIVPEILSRLCSRCSYETKEDLLELLFEVYESEHKLKFQGIGSLVSRLVGSCPIHELTGLIPQFFRFSIPTGLGDLHNREFPNPFAFVDLPLTASIDGGLLDPDVLGDVLDLASSQDANARTWALTTLATLHDLQMLGPEETEIFGGVLWQRVGDEGMPTELAFRRNALLRFPHPSEVDPLQTFMDYVRTARFPMQEGEESTSVAMEGLCVDIRAAPSVPWTDGDVQGIVGRLIEWWEKDWHHLKLLTLREKTTGVELPFFGSRPLKAQLVGVAWTLALVIGRRWIAIRDTGLLNDLRRVVDEMSQEGMGTLALEMASTSLFPEWRERVVQRTEDSVCSGQHEVVADALRAMFVESERTGPGGSPSDEEFGDLGRLLGVLSRVVCHGRGRTLVMAMQTMADLVERHPWCLGGEVERRVLSRIRGVIEETAGDSVNPAGRHVEGTRRDVDLKLQIRRGAAFLAYRLFGLYRESNKPVPNAIREWEEVCESKSEFAEIRRQWIKSLPEGSMSTDDG